MIFLNYSKTAAFLVPILNRMLEQGASMNPQSNRPYQRRKQYPLGLVLAPVSEINLKIDTKFPLNL